MKKLLFFLLALAFISCIHQKPNLRSFEKGEFNILEFGADPTGSTESTTAIQAALNACDSGTVYFPQGYYLTGTLIIPNDNTTMKGAGKYLTTLQLIDDADAGTSWGNLIYCGGVDGFTLRDIQLDGNGLNQTKIDNRGGTNKSRSIGVCADDSTGTLNTNYLSVENCSIKNFARSGVIWSIGNRALVKDCYFYNNFISAVEFWGRTGSGRIENCIVRKGTGFSLFGNNHEIYHCKVEYPYNAHMWDAYDFGLSLESVTWGPDSVSITDFTVIGDTLTYGVFSATNGMRQFRGDNITVISTDPDHYAINMQHDTLSQITNSHITGTKYGITLTSSINATVSGNQISGGALQGIQLGGDADKNKILNNDVTKTAGYPIYINSGATGNIIANNILLGTWYGGIILDGGTGTVQFNNYSVLDGSKMPDKVANNTDYLYIATSDGLTTGLIASGSQNITVTSASANYILCLPTTGASNIGQVITGQIGANGFELRVIAAQAATVYINGVTTNVEAAIPANSSFEIKCLDATHWILKAWTALGAEITAIIPDAI